MLLASIIIAASCFCGSSLAVAECPVFLDDLFHSSLRGCHLHLHLFVGQLLSWIIPSHALLVFAIYHSRFIIIVSATEYHSFSSSALCGSQCMPWVGHGGKHILLMCINEWAVSISPCNSFSFKKCNHVSVLSNLSAYAVAFLPAASTEIACP